MENNRPAYNRDEEHLKLLGIFHYVCAGMMMLFSLIFIFHAVIGLVMLINPQAFESPDGDMPPKAIGLLFAIMGTCPMIFGWTLGILTIVSGRMIQRKRRRTFSLVIAGINCLWMPFGTILGVFTIIVLLRESVIMLYQEKQDTDEAVGAGG